MKITTTERGFPIAEFKDKYNHECSIQQSSIMDEPCIWLGINNAEPQIMASQAKKFGLIPTKNTGWVPFPIHEDVLLSTRMHLNIDQVKALLPLLQRFVETGEIIEV